MWRMALRVNMGGTSLPSGAQLVHYLYDTPMSTSSFTIQFECPFPSDSLSWLQ